MDSVEEQVQILIEARNLAGPAMEEAKLQANNFKKAVESLNRSMADGATISEAAKRAMNELTRGALEAGLSFRETKNAVNDTRQALEKYIAVVSAGMAPQDAFNLILGQTIAEMEGEQVATSQASGAFTGGVPAIAMWVGGIAAALVILYPFVALVGSAAVLLTSFAVGAMGFVAVLGAVGAGIAGLGALSLILGGAGSTGAAQALTKAQAQLAAAQYALAHFNATPHAGLNPAQQLEQQKLINNLAAAQQHYNAALLAAQGPVAVLVSKFSDLKAALAQVAEPIAAQIATWIESYIPAIQAVGTELFKWFGAQLPGILKITSQAIKDLTPDFQGLASFIAQALGGLNGGGMLKTFESIVRMFVIPAIEGLITNLIRLSNWFVSEFPSLAPKVLQIFGSLGNMIQWVADHWSQLTDFVETKWPATVKQVQQDLKLLSDWWQKNGDTITTFGSNVLTLMGIFDKIIPLFMALYNFLNGVGLAPTALLKTLNNIVSTLESIYGWVTAITGAGGARNSQVPFNPRGAQFGASIYAGQTMLVGEAGPELLTLGPGLSGSITPNDQLGGMNTQNIEMYLAQLVDIGLAQLQNSNGLGYGSLASIEYARSRGIQ